MRSFGKICLSIVLLFGIVSFINSGFEAYGMELKSKAFSDNSKIPLKYTGLSYNMSPPLRWQDLPIGTKSLVLIVDDLDAPIRTWTHWVVYDIPAELNMLRENIPARGFIYNGMKQGKNSFHMLGYGGPYPPPGPEHRYIFTLYAIDKFTNLSPGEDKNTVLLNINGHVLDKTDLTGIFGR